MRWNRPTVTLQWSRRSPSGISQGGPPAWVVGAAGVALALCGGLPGSGQEPREWPVREVSGDVNAGGRISAGTPATEPTEAVRLGEMPEDISSRIRSFLPEFHQEPGTLAVSHNASVTATGPKAHAEGQQTWATGSGSHAEGTGSQSEAGSHAEGDHGWAAGSGSHAEGAFTGAFGNRSHAEGCWADAWDSASHAEGAASVAMHESAHAEGCHAGAAGKASHAEGFDTVAGGHAAHAQGRYCWADGAASHAAGRYVYANHEGCFIHAAGVEESQKYSQADHTAHFDRLYTFETWGEDPPANAVLNRGEMDQQYIRLGYIPAMGDLPMGDYTTGP